MCYDLTPCLSPSQTVITNFILPLLGKSTSTGTQKLPLCFLKDATHAKWLEVFQAWELGKLVGEDGKRPANIPKPPRSEITMNDVDRTIGLRDSELFLLAEAILRNEVSVKSNKLATQRETMTLNEWCMMRKYDRVIKNELMFKFKGKPLPNKKTGFQQYSDEEWEELALERNFTDAVISNIRGEVMTLREGSEWVHGRMNNLNPTSNETAPAPNVFQMAVEKFARCTVGTATGMSPVMYDVRVSTTLEETLGSLTVPAAFWGGMKEKVEIFFVFGFDSTGNSVYVRKQEFKSLSERISKDEDPDFGGANDDDDEGGPKLQAPSYLLLDFQSALLLYAQANAQKSWYESSSTYYLPSDGKPFKKAAVASKPLVSVSVLYNRPRHARDEWRTFSEFTGIRSALQTVWEEDREGSSQDWSGGKCSPPYALVETLLGPALKKYKCVVVNVWGGGNVSAVALVSSLLSSLCPPWSVS